MPQEPQPHRRTPHFTLIGPDNLVPGMYVTDNDMVMMWWGQHHPPSPVGIWRDSHPHYGTRLPRLYTHLPRNCFVRENGHIFRTEGGQYVGVYNGPDFQRPPVIGDPEDHECRDPATGYSGVGGPVGSTEHSGYSGSTGAIGATSGYITCDSWAEIKAESPKLKEEDYKIIRAQLNKLIDVMVERPHPAIQFFTEQVKEIKKRFYQEFGRYFIK